MSEVLLLALSFVLNNVLPYFIVRYDLKRLSEERLARAWPDVTVLSAAYYFGPLCLPVHFARTRRSWLGFGLGLGVGALVVAGEVGIIEGLSRILGVD
jgi:hypothetical protein